MPDPQERTIGEHDPPGVTIRQILELIYNNLTGIAEPDIRRSIKDHSGIDDPTGVKRHLRKLERKHYITLKSASGKANSWSPPKTLDSIPSLLSDRWVWGAPQSNRHSVEEISKNLKDKCDNYMRLFHTEFFEKIVKPKMIQKLLSSPPLLDIFSGTSPEGLTNIQKSKNDEKALKEFYSKALSQSPTVMVHMFIPSQLIRAGLDVIQMNSRTYANITEQMIEKNEGLLKFTDEQREQSRKLLQYWKDHAQGEVTFTSVESLSLASVYLGVTFDLIQFPSLQDELMAIISDKDVYRMMFKFLPTPSFIIEFNKFYKILESVWRALFNIGYGGSTLSR